MPDEPIGKVIATEKNPTTIDSFSFWTKPDMILHPFDVVKVEHLHDSLTFGVIEEISHLTDATSFLTNFISSDFGDADMEDPTLRIGMNVVTVKVTMNTKHIDSPVINNQRVYLASRQEVEMALGLDQINNPVPCGYLQMYEDTGKGITLPVSMNSDFLIGPEGAHLSISGISGLAAKTSYAMFLLKAIQDKSIKETAHSTDAEEEGVAIVVFNVKGRDLLAIDEQNDFDGNETLRKETLEKYQSLGLTPLPFQNVTYLYPASDANHHNSYVEKSLLEHQRQKNKAFFYKYSYDKDKENLNLMFSDTSDPNQTIESIINYIVTEQGSFRNLHQWSRMLECAEEMGQSGHTTNNKEIPVQSWRKFSRLLKKTLSNHALFEEPAEDDDEVRIADMIKKIHANDVYVVDMAKLDSNMQSFVFGSTVQEIMDYQLGEKEALSDGKKPPARIVIFIDELNKYASADAPKNSPILHKVLEIAERGRSLKIVLFGAEQFMSAIHSRVSGNCANFAYGRTNAIEVAKQNYRYVPKVYQSLMTRLKPGEYLLQSFSFNSLLHVKFPLPIYRQFK